jgi:hypothetical protein
VRETISSSAWFEKRGKRKWVNNQVAELGGRQVMKSLIHQTDGLGFVLKVVKKPLQSLKLENKVSFGFRKTYGNIV